MGREMTLTEADIRFLRYCGKDAAVTYEISEYHNTTLGPTSMAHYRWNVELLNALLYMEVRGIRYNVTEAKARCALLWSKKHEVQARLNAATGHRFSWTSLSQITNYVKETMLVKKGDRPYTKYVVSYKRVAELLNQPSPDLCTVGEIEDLCEVSLNVDTDHFRDYLYETLKLPKQYNTNRQTGKTSVTTDYEALLKLSRHCQKHNLSKELQIIQLSIEIRSLITRAEMLGIMADSDGRIRCAYNLVGSETGRITSYKSPTGSGYNLQTIPKYTNVKDAPGGVLGDRDLFIADPDHWFFQCDLSGADGWTVAAYCAMLGDPTMLLDYRFGLKPAKILTLMLRGVTVDYGLREALKEAGKAVDGDDWDYFASKRVQHGGAYCEGPITISRAILKDSEGKLYWEPSECSKLKNFYFTRYPGIERWHRWVEAKIKARPILTAASGQTRRFFGRPDDLIPKAVAFEPQANTTYATNLAMYRLWTDAENKTTTRITQGEEGLTATPLPQQRSPETGLIWGGERDRTTLRVEPLHTVHDALCGQFHKSHTPWAADKIKSWFNNPLIIAGQEITIPYEGGYGTSWGSLKEGKL